MSFTMDAEAEADALTAKIITMVCLFGISMITGCLPLLISLKWDWFKTGDANLRNSNQLVMGLLAFGGGILFATTFMHLLPEVDENIEHLQDEGELPEFPLFLAGLIMCAGFFMIYLIEELVHLYINSRENKKRNTSFAKPFKMRKSSLTSGRSIEAATAAAELSQMEANGKKGGENHLPLDDQDSVAGALRGLLIVLALSIHELFEGLAVGLESSVANVCIQPSKGLACGTLVYVVFFEVWKGCNGLLQFSCALFGFAVMFILSFYLFLKKIDIIIFILNS
ncbi:hypothetical protein SFRURICE_008101 [Spodoptera frugiperda]|nr:hypothetical protein SFRURICE_008101 [Spodoptera frugiperda]